MTGFDLERFLVRHRAGIIKEWVERLRNDRTGHYYGRPEEELYGTVSEAYDDNCSAILHGDYRPIDCFIENITKLRLQSGFALWEVQKAFEQFREITIPLLGEELGSEDLSDIYMAVNRCLAYTIYRFSDYFQSMHEKTIREHNVQLKEEVRKRTAELEDSRKKYKTLVEEINDGYVVVRSEFVIFSNLAFARIHGYKPEEVVGMYFYDLVSPEDRDKMIHIYKKSYIKRDSPPKAFEYMRLTRDGESFPTEILARVTYYDNKLSTIGICRDITERVKMERMVREAERLSTIGQITTSLSHEIRNPLSAVNLNLQVIKKSDLLKGNDKRRIEIAVREVGRLERILTELLDFAKPITLNLEPADVNQIVRQCTELLDVKFKEKKIRLMVRGDESIPAAYVDAEKTFQAIINLLLNAIDASPSQGAVHVSTRLEPDAGTPEIVISVRDEGGGLPHELAEKIGKPFFTTKSKGVGLGLANVDRVAEAHGGRLEYGNIPPTGAEFLLVLPVGGVHGDYIGD